MPAMESRARKANTLLTACSGNTNTIRASPMSGTGRRNSGQLQPGQDERPDRESQDVLARRWPRGPSAADLSSEDWAVTVDGKREW
jgi:hypothetical protein